MSRNVGRVADIASAPLGGGRKEHHVYFDQALHLALERVAAAEKRSVSSQIAHIVEAVLSNDTGAINRVIRVCDDLSSRCGSVG